LLLFLLLLSQRVVFRALKRQADIVLLAFLRAAANEDHKRVAVFAEGNAAARTKIDAVFLNTSANALGVGEIALLNARQSSRHLGRGFCMKTVSSEGTAPGSVEVFAQVYHG
jgi:hypothetical protein